MLDEDKETDSSRMPTPTLQEAKAKKSAKPRRKPRSRFSRSVRRSNDSSKNSRRRKLLPSLRRSTASEPSPNIEPEVEKEEKPAGNRKRDLDENPYPPPKSKALVLPSHFSLDVGSLHSLSLAARDWPDASKLKRRFGHGILGDPQLLALETGSHPSTELR